MQGDNKCVSLHVGRAVPHAGGHYVPQPGELTHSSSAGALRHLLMHASTGWTVGGAEESHTLQCAQVRMGRASRLMYATDTAKLCLRTQA